jgi:hypothetical protein
VILVLVKALRRQDRRDDRHLGFELHLHQGADDGVGDEFVTVDAAVDDEPRSDDGGISSGPRGRRGWRCRSGSSADPCGVLFDEGQNQGARDRPGNARGASSSLRYPVLSHPDCDRRLRDRTGSADPAGLHPIGMHWRAHAGLCDVSHLPPVGTSTPPRERLPPGGMPRRQPRILSDGPPRQRLFAAVFPPQRIGSHQKTPTPYSRNTGSIVTTWSFSIPACAMSMRSKGSLCGPGSRPAASAWSSEMSRTAKRAFLI